MQKGKKSISKELKEKVPATNNVDDKAKEYTYFFNNCHDLICIANSEGYFERLNPQFEKLLGYTLQELTERPFLDFVHPDDLSATLLEMAKLSNGAKTINFANRYRKTNGDYLWLEWSSSTDLNTGKTYAIARDISKMKIVEDQLKQSKLFLETILHNIPDMVFVKEAKDLRFVKMNKAGEELLGLTEDQLIGKNDHDLFPKDMADEFTQRDSEVLAKKGYLEILEEPIDTKRGKRWLHTQKIPILDEHGNPSHLLGISSDITLRKKAQEKQALSYNVIRSKHKDIIDSLNYAKRIQEAFMPAIDPAWLQLSDAFIVNEPKDILSGDFHWSHYDKTNNCSYLALGDCTGHGVPGSLMTMLSVQLLEHHILRYEQKRNPKKVLDKVHASMVRFLAQDGALKSVSDGMEVVLFRIDHADQKIFFSSAGRPFYHVANGQLQCIKQSKFSVGGVISGIDKQFELGSISYDKGDRIYAFSDGFADQFGGKKGRKMLRKRRDLILQEIQAEDFKHHGRLLNDFFQDWKGNNSQVDDMIIMGICL